MTGGELATLALTRLRHVAVNVIRRRLGGRASEADVEDILQETAYKCFGSFFELDLSEEDARRFISYHARLAAGTFMAERARNGVPVDGETMRILEEAGPVPPVVFPSDLTDEPLVPAPPPPPCPWTLEQLARVKAGLSGENVDTLSDLLAWRAEGFDLSEARTFAAALGKLRTWARRLEDEREQPRCGAPAAVV